MKSKTKNQIRPETAWGIIGTVSLVLIGIIVNASLNMPKEIMEQLDKIPESAPANKQTAARILFASNGKREIYKIQRDDGKWVVIIDGQESGAYDSVDNAVFSQDGKHFAFSGTNGDETEVVLDGKAQEGKYKNVIEIVFNQNGDKLAYVAVDKNGKSMVIVNGQSGKTYDEIGTLKTSSGESYIIFSPDGNSYAYKVTVNGQTFVVVNGKEEQAYSDIINFSFNSDGSYSYTAINQSGQQITIINGQKVTGNNLPPSPPASSGSSGGSSDNSGNASPKYKGNRFKNDINLDPNRTTNPGCNSNDCNF